MKVLILDDDINCIRLLKNIISKHFDDVEYVLNDYYEKCDIYFLDIDLDKVNGIDIAKEIKKINPNSLLVFVSHREDLIFDALETFPYSFVRKSQLDKDMDNVLNKVKEIFEPDVIEITSVEGNFKVKVSQIIYIEKLGRYCYIHTNNKVFQAKQPLKYYKQVLNDDYFEYVSQAILVNVDKIISENKDCVEMIDHNIFYYSRARRKSVRIKYINQKMKY